jgi:predicted nucleic acid-binding protein
MQDFVLDCSATLAYFFKDETSPYVDSAFHMMGQGSNAYVPPNWAQEVVNTCMSAMRRKRISSLEVMSIYRILATLPINIVCHNDLTVLKDIHKAAVQYDLSAYDAAYLQLAIDKNIPLVTLDKHLKRMAKKAGVTLWLPAQH